MLTVPCDPHAPRRPRPAPAGEGPARGGVRDDGLALMSVLVLLVLMVPLALAAVTIVLKRQKDVVYERSRTSTVHAAETGLDAVTSAVRAATAADGSGSRAGLPCGPVSGDVGAQAPGLRYTVTIRYYLDDPGPHDETWRSANQRACTPGSGPDRTPHYALLQSASSGSITQGSFAALRERRVESVYRFDIEDSNVNGGLVHTYTDSTAGAVDLCWASGDTPPVVGSQLVAASCQEGAAAQRFAYRPDHSFTNNASGLCVTSAGSTPMTLQTCAGSDTQKYVFTGNDHFAAVSAGAQASTCIAMQQTYTAGTPLVLTSTCGDGDDATKWAADTRTGPGGAGPATDQLVNFGQYSRCIDVTAGKPDVDFLHLHPCKQSPATLVWPAEQFVYVPDTGHTGQWKVEDGGDPYWANYCLTTPSAGSASEYVVTKPCTGASEQKWSVSGNTGAYATSYTIVDASGRCLSAGPPPLIPGSTYSSVIAADCDGSLIQKWNAPALLVTAGEKAFHETTGS